MKNREGIGKLISIKMEERGINQAQLASALNYSEGWMSQVLNGEIELTVSVVKEIAKVLNVDPRSLIPVDEETSKQTFEQFLREICREEARKLMEEMKAK